MRKSFVCLSGFVALAACAPARTSQRPTPVTDSTAAKNGLGSTSLPNADPFPSTYVAYPSGPMVIRNGAVAVANGKIVAVGQTVNAPAGATVIDGKGKYVTPGIIDATLTLASTRRRAAMH